jgi:hypothetical protein
LRDHNAFADAVRPRGTVVVGDALHRPQTAPTIRPGPSQIVTDGPFAETVEQIGRCYVIDVRDLDAAVDLAQLHGECVVEVGPTLGAQV